MSSPHVALQLPAPERGLLAGLVSPWRDVLYAPGPGFTSPLDPGAYRTSIVIVPSTGPAVRVSSVVTPAFGAEICRLRLEALPRDPPPSLGSFFDPARTGTVYALTPGRDRAAAQAPAHADWRYDGVSLAPRLGGIRRMHVLRERGRGPGASWEADRGLVFMGADDVASLVLAVAEPAEAALFLPSPGLYVPLVDPEATPKPGVTVRDLLGHGERDGGVEITIERIPIF